MTIPALPAYAMPQGGYQNKVSWKPDPARSALLVHDMQAYFLNKFDTSAEPIPELVRNAARLRDAFHAAEAPVFYTAQPVDQPAHDRALLNDMWGPGLTDPAMHVQQPIIDELAPAPQDTVLVKWRYSAFQRSDLRDRLRALGRDQLVICGIYAHIGCMATALEAFMQDVQPFMAADAVADFSRAEHEMALRYVSTRCGAVITTDEVEQLFAAAKPVREKP
ncbi:isochorismatase family protein [Paracandidimonas soli]|uniref:Bifunctional isochorismate lyase/aryl carrier protein n=1 Tax=Paracandidimonas soli TaxID=1917182 RepID=A0A4R3UX21_9BURK|nr:isochorismatase family protein [Paracandidimonas soli]TCU94504.1 bifunctional isochorismate lyase/aryl carrier protein [Paracandidimonas soli]